MKSHYPLSSVVAACLLAGCAQVGTPTFAESGTRVQANPPGFSPGNFVVSEAEWQRLQSERTALASAVAALKSELATLREQMARKETKPDAQLASVAQALNGSEPGSRAPGGTATASPKTVTDVARLFAPRRPPESSPPAPETAPPAGAVPARGAAPSQPDGLALAAVSTSVLVSKAAPSVATAAPTTRPAPPVNVLSAVRENDAWEGASTAVVPPAKPSPATQAGHKTIFSALFKFAQTAIDLDIRDALRGKKEVLVSAPRIELRAFADPIGKRELNEQIASGRALAVKKELEAMGVPGDRIKVSTTVATSAPEGSEILGLFRPDEFRARRVDIALMTNR